MIFRDLCRQKCIELIEGYVMRDHIHILLMIPPKFTVFNTVGFFEREICDPDISKVTECTERFYRETLSSSELFREDRGGSMHR